MGVAPAWGARRDEGFVEGALHSGLMLTIGLLIQAWAHSFGA